MREGGRDGLTRLSFLFMAKAKAKFLQRARAARTGARSGVRGEARMDAAGRFSLDIVTGAQNLATLSPQDLFDRQRPEDIKAASKMSRDYLQPADMFEQLAVSTALPNLEGAV